MEFRPHHCGRHFEHPLWLSLSEFVAFELCPLVAKFFLKKVIFSNFPFDTKLKHQIALAAKIQKTKCKQIEVVWFAMSLS